MAQNAHTLHRSFGKIGKFMGKSTPSVTEVYIQGMLIGHAHDGAFVASPAAAGKPSAAPGRGRIASKGGQVEVHEEISFNYRMIEVEYPSQSNSPDALLRSKIGMSIAIKAGGRVLAAGKLKGLKMSRAGRIEGLEIRL
ncbi:MAG: hypothetical protein AAF756_09580 [Pseudomonadota bacterium]